MAKSHKISGHLKVEPTPEPSGLWVEQQLHEQFAQNYNSISSTLITFFVALLAIYGGVGYALHELLLPSVELPVYSISIDSTDIEGAIVRTLIKPENQDSVNISINCSVYPLSMHTGLQNPQSNSFLFFTIAIIAAMLVTCFIGYLCITQGYATRRDQFLIHKFRTKAYRKGNGENQNGSTECKKAPPGYPENYTPYNKNFFNYIVGIFINLLNASYITIIFLNGLYYLVSCFIGDSVFITYQYVVYIFNLACILFLLSIQTRYYWFKYKKLSVTHENFSAQPK